MWMLPLYLHVNQKSDYDDGYDMIGMIIDIAPKFYSTVSLPYNLQVKVTDLLIILFIFGIQIAAMEAAPRPTHPHLSSKILQYDQDFKVMVLIFFSSPEQKLG